jgi:ABC-2 type transport system permease protein
MMILAMMYREFRIRSTSLIWMFTDLMVPLAYLFLFGAGFTAAFSTGVSTGLGQLPYSLYFLPGVLAMASFGIAINASYGIFVDRDNGMLFEFLTYPMTRSQFLLGKILFSCLLALVQALITLVAASALMRLPVPWSCAPAVGAAILGGTAGWFFFLAIFAFRIRRNDMYNTLINVVYFLFMFASSIFYPLEAMPAWLRWASTANPLTWHADVLRWAIVGGDAGAMALKAGAFALFLLLSLALAVRMLRYRVLE